MNTNLTFREADHTYWLGEVQVPGVSQILFESGLTQVSPYYTEQSRIRGQFVHKACELIDNDDLNFDSLDDVLKPYVAAYQKFLAEVPCKWQGIEQIVFNADLFYAGRLDRQGILQGEPCILDIKTSTQVQPQTALQLAAYSLCFEQTCLKRFALQLKANGTYKLHYFPDKTELNVWQSAVQLTKWKRKNNKPLSSKGNATKNT